MRSTAPAIACAPPLISASLVLVGKSTASPVGAFKPAVPISSARSIRPKPGRISPPRKRPSASSAIDGDRGTDHHHQRRPRRALPEHVVARADERGPAVRAQPVRVVVAVRHATGLRSRHDPTRHDIPQLELLLDAPADRLAGDDAAEHAGRLGEPLPFVVGQPVDRLEEHRAVREQHGARLRGGVLRPFQTGVADIDREKAHARTPAQRRGGAARSNRRDCAVNPRARSAGTLGATLPLTSTPPEKLACA